MKDVYILDGTRTPIGSFMGSLSSLTASKLGAACIKSLIDKCNINPDNVDEVIMGNVLSAGIGQAPARQAALYAGLNNSTPCLTINKVCGSGMKAVMLAAKSIKCGDSNMIMAGGMESMSNAPYLLDKARSGYRMGNGTLIDSMVNDGLWDPYHNVHMGNCGDKTAEEFNFSREELDDYSAESYRRALNAQEKGTLSEEICTVEIPQRKGDPLLCSEDEEPKKGNIDKLSKLRPAFNKDGVITAGNASSLNDGAAALLVCSEEGLQHSTCKPIAKIVGYTTYAGAPEWFTTAPAFAIEKLLKQHNLSIDDVDLFEVNEAFSVVSMVVAKKLGIPHEKMNVNGGAVSLGHPIGMTGARLVLTAAYELKRRNGKYAIATPCIGGGEATAILLERI